MKPFILYARKSSEAEDRQVLSIDSQIKEVQELAKRQKITIVDILTESKSAKAPGRPIFGDLVQRINNGEAQGIICWKLDRLARNAVDGGSIIWLVKDRGIEIVTPSQTYSHISENSFMMYIEFGIAQKFIDDLGKNSKRGMKTKAEMGWYPAPAPIGYLNTPDRRKGFKTIEKDPSTYPLIRKCFDMVLGGKQAIEAWDIASKEWKLTGKTGSIISRSAFYYMLTNPFYCGDYEWPRLSGKWYKGKHEPLITTDEFDVIQRMLGRHGKPVAKTHAFDLTGLLRCGECGSAITATKKVKYYKRKNRLATYTYYHCTKKRRDMTCSQHPITEDDLNTQIESLLLRIKLKPEFVEWAKKWIKVIHENESSVQETVLQKQQDTLLRVENRLNKLLDLRLDDKLDEGMYEQKKTELESERSKIKLGLTNTDEHLTSWRKKIETALDFALAAYSKFNTGTRDDKHEVLCRIGSNLLINNKFIKIELKKYYEIFSEQDIWEEKYKDWLEPEEYRNLTSQRPDLLPPNPIWLPGVDSNHEP